MIPAVWAPEAEEVELIHGPDLQSVEDLIPDPGYPDGTGWWRSGINLTAGTAYGFSVDGDPPRPDPRSLLQPRGPHGPSEAVDLSAYTWTDQDWRGRDVRGAVTYELHVGTFTPAGTLDSAIDRLGHLAELGIDMVGLMPLADAPGDRGWGYDGVNIFAVHHAYGGPGALQRFVDAAHGHGLGVTLDVVYNHLGPSGNYLATFGPYFTSAHETPWGQAVNLDQAGSEGVRRWICDNASQWFRDFHIDALRLDAVHALIDDSPEHLLAQLSRETAALSLELGRPLGLVAESDLNDVAMITDPAEGGLGMTAQWADDVHHGIHAWLTGERQGYYVDFGSTETLRTVLTQGFLHTGGFSTFRGKDWGAPVPPGTDGHRFVVSASNHDQVGNRALGDRPGATLSADELAISAALLLTAPFTPMLFMGEEWGASTPWCFFTDHEEPDLAAAVTEGRTREFGGHGWTALYGTDFTVPDPQDLATFEASILNWTESESGVHKRLLDWTRALISLRRSVSDLASGDLASISITASPEPAPEDELGRSPLVIERGDVQVLVNPLDGSAAFPLPNEHTVLLAWSEYQLAPDGPGGGQIVMPGPGVVITGADLTGIDVTGDAII